MRKAKKQPKFKSKATYFQCHNDHILLTINSHLFVQSNFWQMNDDDDDYYYYYYAAPRRRLTDATTNNESIAASSTGKHGSRDTDRQRGSRGGSERQKERETETDGGRVSKRRAETNLHSSTCTSAAN